MKAALKTCLLLFLFAGGTQFVCAQQQESISVEDLDKDLVLDAIAVYPDVKFKVVKFEATTYWEPKSRRLNISSCDYCPGETAIYYTLTASLINPRCVYNHPPQKAKSHPYRVYVHANGATFSGNELLLYR